MKVWIVWDQIPYESDVLLAVCASYEAAEEVAERHRGTAFIEITEHDVSARVHGWNDRAELVEVYEQGRKQFFDDGGWQDPEVRRHECGLLAVANYVAHEPSERESE